MKNKIYKYGLYAAVSLFVSALAACSDSFLEEKRNYGNYDASLVYSSFESANERISDLYFQMLPHPSKTDGNGIGNVNDETSTGYADKFAKSTDEYGGFSIFVNPEEELEYNSDKLFDYFYVANTNYSPWAHIRSCNDVIEGVTGSSTISETDKNKLLGQAYFFRAYEYYQMVKIYGGIPIIDHVIDAIQGDGDGSDKVYPRSTTKECIDFMCADLDKAGSMLPARWESESSDFGRITSGAAKALKAKILLFYASPLFNRADKEERWEAAYTASKDAIETLTNGNFGLVYSATSDTPNGANWGKIWQSYTGSDDEKSEAVFITLCNTKDNVSGNPDYGKYNNWEHSIRPKNCNGNGGLSPTSAIVDAFPMADGKKPGESIYDYDKLKFWLNRDPRFYRTFAFPGVEWKFNEGDVDLTDDVMKKVIPSYYNKGRKYQLWSYTWYDNAADQTSLSAQGWSADYLQTTNHAVYVRKRTDDRTSAPFYVFSESSTSPKGFQKNAAPLIAVRYAEVLLDYAETACGAGHIEEAYNALTQIRERVGYTAANNYGLSVTAGSDRAEMFAAILYERQVELAFEGKRFDDMRRWMLFDGGAGQSALKSSWALTGFGGNTCSYLGVSKLNGTKRHAIVMYSNTLATKDDENDPLITTRPAALTLSEDMTFKDGAYASPAVKDLADFYDANLRRKNVNLDGNDEGLTVKYLPKYYFLGFKKNAMQMNVTLHQTIGWYDFNRSTEGTFDPLAE